MSHPQQIVEEKSMFEKIFKSQLKQICDYCNEPMDVTLQVPLLELVEKQTGLSFFVSQKPYSNIRLCPSCIKKTLLKILKDS